MIERKESIIVHPTKNAMKNRVREAAKKSSSTNGQAIKGLPSPPLELNGHRNFFLFYF